jgi:putative ABC transport system permease protein
MAFQFCTFVRAELFEEIRSQMQTLRQDIRYAFRQLRKSPRFTAVAVLTLALGIGANTAIYSIIHEALQLPYANAHRLVVVENIYPRRSQVGASWPDFQDWRSRSKSFSQVAGLFIARMTWKGISEAEDINVGLITSGYFRMYDMRPILGRGFLPSDHKQDSAPVCTLGESFWRGQLKSDPAVVGQQLTLNDKSCTIVGVMPAVVPDSNHPAQVWMPMEPNVSYREHGIDFILPVGLLRTGVSESSAKAELQSIQSQINKQFPDSAHDVDLQTLSQYFFGDLRSILYILLATVGCILLIACVNLANMLLVRSVSRAHEFAIRRALGASKGRIVRQTLTESLLLSGTGAVVGLALAEILTRIPVAAWPKGYLQPSSVHIDGVLLAFTLVLGLATGLFFGIVPALRMVRQNERFALQHGHAVTNSREQSRTRSILIIAEIALSMLLVAGSIDMAFYFIRLMRTDPGVNPQNVLSMAVSLESARYSSPESKLRFYDTLLEKLAALPSVTRVAATTDPPFWGSYPIGKFSYRGQPDGMADSNLLAGFHFVTPGYFSTVQTPILQGRDFNSQDRLDSPKVVIINREMARKLWPGQSAIGKTIQCSDYEGSFMIIGVAADVRFSGPAQPVGNAIYMSILQVPPSGLSVLLRTRGKPLALVESVRQAVSSIDPERPISNITSIAALADQSVAGQRTATMVTAILGALALLLACIGVYGVVAYAAGCREREFGIRIALGSSRSGILKLLFSDIFLLVAIGMVLGAALTFVMRTWIRSLLGANSMNTLPLVVSALLLCGAAAFATFIPARRASRVDPVRALRAE